MKNDKSRLIKKAKKFLDRTKDKSNPYGWEINFEVVEEYKVQDQIYTLLVYVMPDQGEDFKARKIFWRSV